MASQHTPGPWKVNSLTRIEAADFGLVASIRGGLESPETHANARLIAAAPDMLGALKECVIEISQLRNVRKLTTSEEVALDLARSAIAKAEGRS